MTFNIKMRFVVCFNEAYGKGIALAINLEIFRTGFNFILKCSGYNSCRVVILKL